MRFFVAGIVGSLAGAPHISPGLLTWWRLAAFLGWCSVEILCQLFLRRSHTNPHKGSHLGSAFCLLILGWYWTWIQVLLGCVFRGFYKQNPTEKIGMHRHLSGCWGHHYFRESRFKAGKGGAAAQNPESPSHPAQSWGFCQPGLLSLFKRMRGKETFSISFFITGLTSI